MGNKTTNANVITDRLVRSWLRCRRKAWLDKYADSEKRVWSAHRSLQLDHQYNSFIALLMGSKPHKGIEACEKGALGVSGIRLTGTSNAGHAIQAHPPLLQKIDGNSRWGAFSYRAVLARQGKRITREHLLLLTLTSRLLEDLQESKVTEGIAVSKTKSGLEIDRISVNKKLQTQLNDSIDKLLKDLSNSNPPPLTADRRKCSFCSWKGICNVQAIKEENLSEVSGIGVKRKQNLQKLGIQKITDLAKANPLNLSQQIEALGERNGQIAYQLIDQANSLLSGCEQKLNKKPTLPELQSANGVLLYDIESDPDAQEDFLHGFVSMQRCKNGAWDINQAKYEPVLNIKQEGQNHCWDEIKNKLIIYKDWPVLHYGETEILQLSRLAKKHHANIKDLEMISNRFIDIHERIRKNWLLPLNSYGLKTVANWTGFKWGQPGADGARALLWWRQWKNSSNQTIEESNSLQRILRYNKDDCLATWCVANWLLKKD